MDIIIPLGKGSKWQNNELRYCLRSIEKHLVGYNNIFIIGEKPDWIKDIIHIPATDNLTSGRFRDENIFRKILIGCADERVSSEFLFFNDDHFLLQDFDADCFPYLYQGSLEESISGYTSNTPYKKTLVNTLTHCHELGFGTLDFDIHCPIRYDKIKFICSMPVTWQPYGYAIKSMYCNINSISGIQYDDLKFREPLLKESIYKVLQGRYFFSIGDKCLKGDMKEVLTELYPYKSKFEI